MGMSSHVVGIKPPDEIWKKMKAAWDACHAAHVEPPKEVMKFFEGEAPDPAGVLIDLIDTNAVNAWDGDGKEGFEVNLKSLPRDVTVIRFYNAW